MIQSGHKHPSSSLFKALEHSWGSQYTKSGWFIYLTSNLFEKHSKKSSTTSKKTHRTYFGQTWNQRSLHEDLSYFSISFLFTLFLKTEWLWIEHQALRNKEYCMNIKLRSTVSLMKLKSHAEAKCQKLLQQLD